MQDDKKKKSLTLRVSQELFQALGRDAMDRSTPDGPTVTRSEVARELLEGHYKEREPGKRLAKGRE